MSKRLSYERYLWFHQRLKKNTYPKLRDLMEKFEISRRQAAREIESMRLFFKAPVEYSIEEQGYYYSDRSFEFPAAMVSEEEIISLIIAQRLAVTIPDPRRKSQLHSFFEHLSVSFDLDVAALEKKISLKNIRYYRVNPDVFDAVLQGLNKNRKLFISYRSVHNKENTERTIAPLHLILYMGSWHIIAYCEVKKGIRDFALSRIQTVTLLAEPVADEWRTLDIKSKIDDAYGIFFEGPKTKVVLKFSEAVKDYVREQVWFPRQELHEDTDSNGIVSLLLTFYVTDFREVAGEVLRFGGDVEVLEPQELRAIVQEKIRHAAGLYFNNKNK